jgi:hypothetical protein
MLKSIFSFGGAFFLMVSCTCFKPILPVDGSYSDQCNSQADKKRTDVQSDFEIMKGWSEEERQYFIDHFVYKSIEIRNDTLIFVK